MKKTYKISKRGDLSEDKSSSKTVLLKSREQYEEVLALFSKFSIDLGNARRFSVLFEDEMMIPATIFSTKLSPLEALVLYLNQQRGMRLSEIAGKLNRDQRTIWITLRNARNKRTGLSTSQTTTYVPLRIFSERKLSILEHLCLYLKDRGMRLRDISALLGKAPNTIWTCHHRAKEKGGDGNIRYK